MAKFAEVAVGSRSWPKVAIKGGAVMPCADSLQIW